MEYDIDDEILNAKASNQPLTVAHEQSEPSAFRHGGKRIKTDFDYWLNCSCCDRWFNVILFLYNKREISKVYGTSTTSL